MRIYSIAPSLLLLVPFVAQQSREAIEDPALPSLFATTLTQPLAGVGVDDVTVQSRVVEIDIDLLANTSARTALSGAFQLNLFPGQAPIALLDVIEPAYGGGMIWQGHIEGDPLSDVVFSVMDNVVSGTINWQDQLYRVGYGGNGVHRVNLVDPTLFKTCATGDEHIVSEQDGSTSEPNGSTESSRGNPDIDILVVYSTVAKNAVGGTNSMLSRINLAFTETNSAYTQSGITQSLVLVHTEEMIGYNESSSFSTILNHLTNPNDGKMDIAHTLRNQHNADAVAMICNNSQYCGVAWLMTNVSNSFKTSAFSVTYWSCATGYYSFGHELGHNFGSAHDPANAGSAAYNYSYGFRTSNNQYRTIMAYSPGTRIKRFSGPGVIYAGKTMGNASQDNARSLNNTAPTVADWRVSGLNALFSTSTNNGIVPLAVNFTNQSSGATSYSWDFGDGGTSTQTNPSHTYLSPGSYSATLTATGGGSNDTYSVTIVAAPEPAPTAAFSATPLSGSLPLLVSFTNQSTGAITSYLWEFGDGGTSTQTNPTYTYTVAGAFGATLTTTGPGGSDSTSISITVNEPAPVANFTATPTSGSTPLSVSFTDTTVGVVWFYSWDFGDGGTASTASPNHTFNGIGTYTAAFTVVGPGGVDTYSEQITVTEAAPTADFSANTTYGGAPLSVNFSDLSAGTVTTHAWDFGDGGNSSQANPNHSFVSPGTYTVSLTVSGPGGSNTKTKVDFIVVEPAAAIVPYGCGGNPAGSLTVISGLPIPGTSVVLGIDNPLGTQAVGSIPILVLSLAADGNFPCGTSLPGFGMSGNGELLVSLAPSNLIQPMLVGAPWTGAGNPAPIAVPIPNLPSVIGLSVFAQGLLLDLSAAPGGVRYGLTTAVELQAGL